MSEQLTFFPLWKGKLTEIQVTSLAKAFLVSHRSGDANLHDRLYSIYKKLEADDQKRVTNRLLDF